MVFVRIIMNILSSLFTPCFFFIMGRVPLVLLCACKFVLSHKASNLSQRKTANYFACRLL